MTTYSVMSLSTDQTSHAPAQEQVSFPQLPKAVQTHLFFRHYIVCLISGPLRTCLPNWWATVYLPVSLVGYCLPACPQVWTYRGIPACHSGGLQLCTCLPSSVNLQWCTCLSSGVHLPDLRKGPTVVHLPTLRGGHTVVHPLPGLSGGLQWCTCLH